MKRILKKVFGLIRRADNRVMRLLDKRVVFKTKRFSSFFGTDSTLLLKELQAYDKEAFQRYSKNTKSSVFFRVYKGVRNRIFARAYRFGRRILK